MYFLNTTTSLLSLRSFLFLVLLIAFQSNAIAEKNNRLLKSNLATVVADPETYQDQFSTVSYSNNDGSQNWTGNWIEIQNGGTSTDPDGANAGLIRVSGNQLRFEGISGADPYIYRQADLSTATAAILNFDISTSGNLEETGNTDQFQVEISNNGGSSWTVLETFIGDISATRSFDISTYLASNTQFRFGVTSYVFDGGEYFYIDNISVDYLSTSGSNSCGNSNEIGGTIFNDYNNDGICNFEEDRLANVTVSLYDDNGQVGSAVISGANGKYLFTGLNVGTTYRIEFTTPTDMLEGKVGADSKTSVQFTQPGSCDNNIGFLEIGCYCDEDPYVIVPCYVEGEYNGTNSAEPAIAKLLESADGHDFVGTTKTADYEATMIASHNDVGATYGVAWQNTSSTFYASAFHKRYVGFGPDGPDAIYQLDLNGTVIGVIELDNILSATNTAGSDIHDFVPAGNGHVYDLGTNDEVFDGIGKRSFGDMEVSPDANTLYVVNLFDKKIYALDISSGNAANATLITSWDTPDETSAGRHRPFGLAFHDNKLWIGSVDEDGTDAYVHSLDPSGTSFSLELTVALNYNRQAYIGTDANNASFSSDWNPWASTIASISIMSTVNNEIAYPQPMISDIEFADDGAMILGFRDRFGDQSGAEKYMSSTSTEFSYGTTAGDILKACHNGGSYVIESGNNGACSGTGGITESGPGDVEFYHWDGYNFDNQTWNPNANSGMFHWETTQGALLQMKGRSYIMSTAMDPFHDFSGGMIKFDNSTGGRQGIGTGSSSYGNLTGGYTMFETGDWNSGPPASNGTLSKANGLGDLEAACSAQSISIGNLVWLDYDADGIQDPSELRLSGIAVTLTDDNDVVIATTLTDANGYYIFDSINVPGGLSYNTDYKIKVAINGPQALHATISGTSPVNTGNGKNDNDATMIGQTAVVSFSTGASGDNSYSIDLGFTPTGTVGNRIWLDENSDGIQDAGEPGIPNVIVELLDENLVVVGTTTTDTDGGYIFKEVPLGNYTVRVASGLPVGVHEIYDEDNGTTNPNMEIPVTVIIGEYVSADFGYNYTTKSATDFPGMGAFGTIGNRIWNDANGDGVQEPGESGIPNITVELLNDPDLDGVYTLSGTTATTDIYGNYIFDDLTPGAYEVRVVEPGLTSAGFNTVPTYDPDSDADNTSEPIVIAPGDVWLGGDFGYNNPSNPADIGSTVFVDADGNGTYNAANDLPIPGVTIALVEDFNNNGIRNSGEPVVATTVTDGNGNYIFPDLADDNYVVIVTDVNNVIGNLVNSVDPDGNNDEYSGVALSGADQLLEDFGYIPTGHTSSLGLIGDFVFHDSDGGNDQDAGEPGIEGITVELVDVGTGNIISETITDENGMYLFGGLADGNYQVRVKISTIPAGLTNSTDPDGSVPGDNQGTTVVISSGSNNLDQDFGYKAITPYAVSGTVWEDSDAEGLLDGTETIRFEGITIDLIDANDNILSSTETDVNGDYSFTNIPNGTYKVEVTDVADDLANYWHSLGTDSESDPVQVIVNNANVPGIDFGYYIEPAAIGNFVWQDDDKDGIQDAGETGIANVLVTLEIDYNGNNLSDLTVATVTDANGFYSFENLLLDEDYQINNSNVSYMLSAATPATLEPTIIDVNSNGNDMEDSEDPAGTLGTVVQGQNDVTQFANPNSEHAIASYDFGFSAIILPVDLVNFYALQEQCDVRLIWESETEENFDRYELEWSGDGKYFLKIHEAVGSRSNAEASYHFTDKAAAEYNYYRLKMIDIDGRIEYSDVLNIEVGCNIHNTGIVLYPNPIAKDYSSLSVRFFAEREAVVINIIDMYGRTVKSIPLKVAKEWNVVNLDISGLASGTYHLQVAGNKYSKMFNILD